MTRSPVRGADIGQSLCPNVSRAKQWVLFGPIYHFETFGRSKRLIYQLT